MLNTTWRSVSGTSAGYETFEVRPRRGKFGFIEGTVPVLDGKVYVYLSSERLCVLSDVDGGTLIWENKKYRLSAGKQTEIKISKEECLNA